MLELGLHRGMSPSSTAEYGAGVLPVSNLPRSMNQTSGA